MARRDLPRLIPTGNCWCGCGQQASIGAFWARGHDKLAEAALLAAEYGGSVAQLLHAHGFGPGRSVLDEAAKSGVWVKCDDCWYTGAPSSVRNHRSRHHT
jgi:hypothetical protein